MSQGIIVGPFHFTFIRVMIAVGLTRVAIRGERLMGGMNGMDWLIFIFTALTLATSFFHENRSSALIFRLGFAYNICGVYFLIRIFCQSIEDVKVLCIITAVLLIPVAVAMLCEKVFSFNIFSVFGGTSATPVIRAGKIRAAGPFAHPILAGTIGAVCIPLMIGIWKQQKIIAILGLISCLAMIVASTSSGPILSGVAGIVALFMWRYRQHMRFVRWFSVAGYIALDLIMKAPAYYLIARMDLVGGSTGWHRAALIEAAIRHIDEWWMWGTDYTRHWMPTGVYWSEEHSDITNYYLYIGIIGGLPLMFIFILILSKGFSYIGDTINKSLCLAKDLQFLIWSFGASLFVHSVTFISVSYVDQSSLFIYLTLALISCVWSCNFKSTQQQGVRFNGDNANCKNAKYLLQ